MKGSLTVRLESLDCFAENEERDENRWAGVVTPLPLALMGKLKKTDRGSCRSET